MRKLYAQMYSVREDNDKDFKASLKKIAEMGYDGVEFAGYYGMEADELRDYIDQLGLEAVSAHVGFDSLKNNLDEEIEKLKTLGARFIVCPYTEAKSVAAAKEIGQELNGIAKRCKEAGLPLLYHNHNHELQADGDDLPLEILFKEAPDMLQQPDIFWVQHAGLDPLKYLEDNKGRIRLVHLKQLENMESKKNVEASRGIIDLKKAINMMPEAEHIYEQEFSDQEVMDDMASSLVFLKS